MFELNNHTLYGIIIGILVMNFLVPFLKALFGPAPMPKINLSTLTALPRMNSTDLAYMVSEIIQQNDGKYWLISYSTNSANVATITFGYLNQGEAYKLDVMCCIDDSMPPKYPLNKRRKK